MADPVAELRASLHRAVVDLSAAGARDEALADYLESRRVLLMSRGPSMRPRGRVWRLGIVLLTSEGELLRTGQVTRAVEPRWANNQALSAEIRRGYRAAAHAAKFSEGETVNFDTEPIPLDQDALIAADADPRAVLLLRDRVVLVRWSAVDRGAVLPFSHYLREHVELLVSPPQGA